MLSVTTCAQTKATEASKRTLTAKETRKKELVETIAKIKGDYQNEAEKIEKEAEELESKLGVPDGPVQQLNNAKFEDALARLDLNNFYVEHMENEVFIIESEEKIASYKRLQNAVNRIAFDTEKSQVFTKYEKDRYKVLSERFVLISDSLSKKLELADQSRHVSNMDAALLDASEQGLAVELKNGRTTSRSVLNYRRLKFQAARHLLLDRFYDLTRELKDLAILKDELGIYFRLLSLEMK